MDEIFKAIKTTHRNGIFACVAVILLSVSSISNPPYVEAIDEINSFKNISFRYYDRIFEDSILSHSEFNNFVNESSHFNTDLDGMFENYGIECGFSFQNTLDTIPPFLVNKTFKEKKIKNIINDLENKGSLKIFLVRPRIKDIHLRVGSLLRFLKNNNVTRIDFNDINYISGAGWWDITFNVPIALHDSLERSGYISVDNYDKKNGIIWKIGCDSIGVNFTWNDIIFNSPSQDQLFHANGEYFPFVKEFLEDVGEYKLDKALIFFERRQQSGEVDPTISFLGMQIEVSMVNIVGPLIIIFFYIYLFFHVSHLLSISDDEYSINKIYPWVGLYKHESAKIFTLFTVFILPPLTIVSQFILLWSNSVPMILYKITMVILSIIICYFCYHKIISINTYLPIWTNIINKFKHRLSF